MRPGFKQATTTWKPKTQTTTSSNSRPLPSTPNITSSNNSNQKEIQIQNENKEIKETKQIDIISNKLREGIDEMITNITILSNKSVEMENTNKELMNKMKQTENIQNQFEDLIKRINSLENQNKNQQKIIDSLRFQVDGTKKNEKDEWIKQDKERIEQMMKEMKLTQEEMTRKNMN